MTTTYPAIDELKAQAKRLRQAMSDRGTTLTHSAALELIARQHGARDWNTLAALAARPNAAPKRQALRRSAYSRPLSQPAVHRRDSGACGRPGGDLHRITIHFDEPVDVVTFESFSAFRQRVNAQIDGGRRLAEKDVERSAASGARYLNDGEPRFGRGAPTTPSAATRAQAHCGISRCASARP